MLYKASILSYFDIGDVFYHSANKAPLAKRQTLQNKALRCIYLNNTGESTIELHIKSKLLTLEDRRKSNLAAIAHSWKLNCFDLCRSRDRILRSNDTRVLIKPLARSKKFERCFVY